MKQSWLLGGSLLIASGWSGCAELQDGEQESFEDSFEDTESSEQQLTVAEPMRGMYHWDAPNGPALADAAASWLGRDADLALAFSARATWGDISGPSWQLPPWGRWVQAKPGRRLVYSVSLLPGETNGAGPDNKLGTADDVSLQKCADGAYDQTWKTLANNMVANGLSNTIFRLGWEWDGDWFAWSARGKEAQFAGCFRRVVTSMRAAQPNAGFQFDWNPTEDIVWWSRDKIDAAWPGDAYVDYIGVDAYDASWVANSFPYPASCDASCRAARQITAWNDVSQGLNLMRDYAVAHNKQLSVPEWGVWGRADGHGGNDNPVYIQKMHAFMTEPANRVGYQVYFDVNWTDGGHQISDVSGEGGGSSVGRTYRTAYPESAAKYRTLFGNAPVPAPTPTPTPVVDAGTPVVQDAGIRDAGQPKPDAGTTTPKTIALVNPGFESGKNGWSLYGTSAVVNTGVYAGKQQLQIIGGGAEQDVIKLVKAGDKLKLSTYARITKSGEQAFLGMKFLSASGTVLSETYGAITSTSFALRSITFTVPQGATRALVYAYKAQGSGAGAQFDELKLVR
ncbi:MAG TPA: glycosyl hydrolase [Polyangiales bacterium]|nr:glycosyl hydrolase [Polyangiales bacterium]